MIFLQGGQDVALLILGLFSPWHNGPSKMGQLGWVGAIMAMLCVGRDKSVRVMDTFHGL